MFRWLQNLTVFRKILLLVLILVILLAGIGFYAIQRMQGMVQNSEQFYKVHLNEIMILTQLRYDTMSDSLAADDHITAQSSENKKLLDKKIQGLSEDIKGLQSEYQKAFDVNENESEEVRVYTAFVSLYDQYQKEREEALKLSRLNKDKEADKLISKAMDTRDKALNAIDFLVVNEQSETEQAYQQDLQAYQISVQGFAIILLLTILLALVLSLLIADNISHPLKILETAAGRVASGDLDVKWDINSKDEIGSLAASLKTMVENLQGVTQAYLTYAADGIVIINTQGTIKLFNPAAGEMFNYKDSEVIGQNVKVLMPEIYHDMHNEYIQDYKTKVSKFDGKYIEIVGKRKDGTSFPIEATVNDFTHGIEGFFIAILRNITGRKEIERDLRLWAKVFETSLLGVIILDAKGIIQGVNPSFTKFTGYEASALQGLNYQLFKCGIHNVEFETIFQGLKTKGSWEGEICIRKKNGDFYPAWTNVSAVRDNEGQVTNYIVIIRDISSDVQLRQEVNLVGKIQKGSLRADLETEYCQMQSLFQPLNIVSGDFYDYRWDHLQQVLHGFVLDVMGHGMSTALQISAIRILFRQVIEKNLQLHESLAWINNQSLSIFENSFAAAICFNLDFKTGQLTISSAGISHFLHIKEQKTRIITVPGIFLGINLNEKYDEMSIPVTQGDSLIFLSDGLYEILSNTEISSISNMAEAFKLFRNILDQNKVHDDATALGIFISKIGPISVQSIH